MRARFSPILLAAIACLLVGIAAGWWLRGNANPVPVAADDTAGIANLGSELGANGRQGRGLEIPVSPHGEDAAQPSAAPLVPEPDRNAADGRARRADERRRSAREAPRGSAADDLASGSSLDADPQTEGMNAEQRARYRRDDFEAFGDGPTGRSEPSAEVKSDATTARPECLPLGAAGCRRDADCCGAGVCRSRAGQIAGFRECRLAR